MNILHFKRTMRAEDGGVVKAVLDLCATTAQQERPVTIATADTSAVPDDWVEGAYPGVRIAPLGDGQAIAGRLTGAQLARLDAEVRTSDIVHLHSMWSASNIQAAALCRRHNKPYVLSVHGMLDDWCMSQRRLKKVFFLKSLNGPLLKHAAAIHCTAQAELDQASKWIPPGKGAVVPLPLDLALYESLPDANEVFASFPEIRQGIPIVLFLSRIHYKKGLDRLIESSAMLHQRGVQHQLVVAGTGEGDYPDAMQALAKKHGIHDSTPFLGFVSGRKKVALLRAAHLFALPTSQENFGFVYFESLASGTRVLTTKGTDTWPELQASGAGTIVDNTPAAFADAIERLLGTSPEETRQAEQAGRSWVFDNLSAARVRSAYESFYQKIIHGGTA
jgi:glycosyltransferase involved in cell wall biosynthesis